MRCLVMAGAACFALLTSTVGFAQVPADPTNPNEAVPEAMTLPAYGEPINIETAKKVAAGAIAEAKKRNWNGLCIAIVGPSGDWFTSRSRTTARLRPFQYRSTRRVLRHGIGALRWSMNVCLERVISTPI